MADAFMIKNFQELVVVKLNKSSYVYIILSKLIK